MTARVAFSSFPPELVVLSVLGLLTRKQECCHAAFHLVLLNAQHLLHTKDENPEGSGHDHATHNQRTKESEVAVSYGSSPYQAISFAVLTPLCARPTTSFSCSARLRRFPSHSPA